MDHLRSALGIIVILALAWLWSTNRRRVSVRLVVIGLAMQLAMAAILFRVPAAVDTFSALGDGVTQLLRFSESGATFLFGKLSQDEHASAFGFQFALTVVPIIVFFSSLIAVLYHWGIMQRVVRAMASVLQRSLRTSPLESLSAAANVFLGQTEAPLLVRHYLPHASLSEVFAIMVGGFATIAGSTMGVYIAMGIPASTLMIASLLAAPGGLVLAKIAMPQMEPTVNVNDIRPEVHSRNIVDAIGIGAKDGFSLSVNVLVVLLAFVSVMAMTDAGFAWTSSSLASVGISWFPSSLRELLAFLFTPFAWLTGVPHQDVALVASLLGTKLSATEFIAYSDLAAAMKSGGLSERTITISTIALCGFANVASIGIQIGGFSILVPEHRADVARLGFKAMCIGALASLLAACIAGLIIV
ncbi:MAG: NupC/NupG family nucleoside CNT transporter [Candidatus Kapabacteria bacterium]|nr:NupC/NupG family nucleoside CNT transporter [Candidatus Kapabacteria bacterium]